MDVLTERVGRTAGHEEQGRRDVLAYTLDGGNGLSVIVWTLGATLHAVRVPDRSGVVGNVVLNLPDVARYEDRTWCSYLGATLGRYARCVAGARFRLDGVEHRLDANDPPNHIHGGSTGFDRFVWEAEAEVLDDHVALHLELDRPDGDQGYPGAVRASTTYAVHAGRRLSFRHRATATAPTIVDISNHAYWNLAGSGTIDGHHLGIAAGRVLLVDEQLLPVGDPVSVDGSGFDFRSVRPIESQRLDNCSRSIRRRRPPSCTTRGAGG